MPSRVNLRLNAIVDPERAGGRDLADLARLCAEGGATLVQLRDKIGETRAMIDSARAIKRALAPLGVRAADEPLVVPVVISTTGPFALVGNGLLDKKVIKP